MSMKNIKNIIISFIFFSASLTFLSCHKEPQAPLPTEPVQITLTTDQGSLITSENSFALDIFNRISENAPASKNVIISPLSISSALSMTLNGASGSTRDAMLTALKLNGLTPEIINNSYSDLTSALLNIDQRVLINIANSVWTENNFVVKKNFTTLLTNYYKAETKSFDVNDPQVPKQINTWIESKTNGLIKNMIDQIDPSSVMFLINAIYFKGKWSSQFDTDNTSQKPFFNSAGGSAQVPMMRQTFAYKIYNGSGFTLAELPYGQANFVMDVILPDDINGIHNVMPLINNISLKSWLDQMVARKTDVSIPRFKYTYKIELKDILSAMGMGIAFTDFADFSNISDTGLLISLVLHQAFIETNEEGTEAAAATIVGISTSAAPADPSILNIDHPFIFLIRETTTNTILFMGKVVDPLAS
jgi:serine protease inhibitor